MELSNRILSSHERGLIIDFDTIYMDSINTILSIAENNLDKLLPDFAGYTKRQLMGALVYNINEDPFGMLFKEEFVETLRRNNSNGDGDLIIDSYDRTDNDCYTDFGNVIDTFVSHPITWFLCRDKRNTKSYAPFKDREINLYDVTDMDDILDIIRVNNISIIVVPTAEMVSRLATELKDVTIVYPSYGSNMKEFIPNTFFFKYHEVLDKYEMLNKLEIISYSPIGRFESYEIAMG
jgi:hypothetical protein